MKYSILLFITLIQVQSIFCQSLSNKIEWADGTYYTFQDSPLASQKHSIPESEFKRYFDMYPADTYDPLEGIYDFECGYVFLKKGYTQPQYNKTARKLVIVKDGKYLFGNIVFDNGTIQNGPFLIFERIGETNGYRIYERAYSDNSFLPRHSERFVLNDNGTFSIEFPLSANEIKELPDNVRHAMAYSTNVHRIFSGIKIYPTETSSASSTREEWTGTGFALNNGYIATNYHVVDGASEINILGVKGDFTCSFNAKLIFSDKINDVAIIKVDDDAFHGFGTIPYAVKTSMAEVGENVNVLGYPLTTTMGDEIKLTTGIISSKTGFQGNVSQYQVSAPVQPGNSGGPLFNQSGDIIGIVSAKHQGAENVGYAIKTSYLKNLLESKASVSILPANNIISHRNLPAKVKAVKDFVFLIKCHN